MKTAPQFPDRNDPRHASSPPPTKPAQHDRRQQARANRRRVFEASMQEIIAPLAARCPESVPDFHLHYERAMSVQRIMARGFLSILGVRNADDLADDAVSQWQCNMLQWGYDTYLKERAGRPFFPYASKAMWNICLTMARRQRTQYPLVESDLIDRRCHPLKSMMQSEGKDILLDALEELPPNVKESIRLRYLDGKWPREIAQIVGATRTAISSRILRGLHRLFGDLQDRQPDLWPLD